MGRRPQRAPRSSASPLIGASRAACSPRVQPDSGGYAGVYFVVGDRRHPARAATPRSSSAAARVGGLVLVASCSTRDPAARRRAAVLGAAVVPGDAPASAGSARAARGRGAAGVARAGRTRESAALAERGRVAREHARRARALAVRAGAAARGRAPAGPRPRRRPRGRRGASSARTTWPRPGWTRRAQAIGALRGDDMPGPERLAALADAFRERRERRRSPARRASSLRGAAGALPDRPGGADERPPPQRRRARRAAARLRGRRHAADRARTTGRRPTARDGAGHGYGLTGMRERAELLGGRLTRGADRRRLPGRAVAAGEP